MAGNAAQTFNSTGKYISLAGVHDPDTGFSFAMWINTTSLASTRGIAGFLSSKSFSIQTDGDLRGFWGSAYDSTTVNLSADTWYHVVWARDSGSPANQYLIINGTNDATNSTTGTTSSPTLYFGVYQPGSLTLSGDMADVHVYNRAITDEEAREIMYNPGSVTNGLLAYWDCMTGTSTAVDKSINGNDGTITGSPANTENGPPR